MRSVLIAAMLMLGACASSSAEQKPDAAPPGKGSPGAQASQAESTPPPPPMAGGTAVSPLSTGKQRVKGGESFSLRGPTMVTVDKVVYVNQPCPAGVECLHSGVIKTVEFQVSHGDQQEKGAVAMGQPRTIAGVHLQVFDVQPGPVADVEASLPVAPVGGGAQVPTSH